jgi:hypothetical protein
MRVLAFVLIVIATGSAADSSSITVFSFSLTSPSSSVQSTVPLFVKDMHEAESINASYLLFSEFSLFFPGSLSRNETWSICSNQKSFLLNALTSAMRNGKVWDFGFFIFFFFFLLHPSSFSSSTSNM